MADLEDVTLDGRPLHSLRVADLKAALEERGLPKSGQKNALIKRLKGALMLENLQRTSTPHIGLQPNSQIGEEMSQNSFIKQYLAKQQELLRQRLEREAREAVDSDDQEDHTEVNNSSCPAAAQDVAPVMGDQNKLLGSSDGEGLAGPANEGEGYRAREGNMSGPPASALPTSAPGSMAMRIAGGDQHPERVPASSQVPADSDDEDSEGGEEDGEDDDWENARRRRSLGEPARGLVARERSGASHPPPQHIPPLLSPQLRQPTPPPSPPPELSFPLPDTPKQSPPSPDVPPARQRTSSTSSSGSSTSGSRSSSPEPQRGSHAERKPGPLTLLARKMESEGAFSGAEWRGHEGQGDRQDNSPAPTAIFPGRGPPEGMISAIAHTANSASSLSLPMIPGTNQGVIGAHLPHTQGPVSVLRATPTEERDREREQQLEREKALEQERLRFLETERQRVLEQERAMELERERALAREREEREKALEQERVEREKALDRERIEREKALQRERELALKREQEEREQALIREKEERERALAKEREEREQALARERALELERQREIERQRALELERQRALEQEQALQREREERERALELERAKALERERQERERALELERLERERVMAREREEKERIEKEKALEQERIMALEREREEKERMEREALERERIEMEKALERERAEKEKALERERAEKEKALERERVEKEKRLEQERIEKEKALEQERIEKEKALERERIEKEKALERERIEKEKVLEQERIEKEKALEQEKIEKEKALERERIEKERALEREKIEKEKALEREMEKEKALQKEREEREKAEREKALELERLEKERREKALEQERLERDRALEKQRKDMEKALEDQRREKEKALELERARKKEKERERALEEQKERAKAAETEKSHLHLLRRGPEFLPIPLPTMPTVPAEASQVTTMSEAAQPQDEDAHIQKTQRESQPAESTTAMSQTQGTPLSPQSSFKKFRFLRDPPGHLPTAPGSMTIKRPRTFSDTPQPQASPLSSPTKAREQEREGFLPSFEQEATQVLSRQGVLVSGPHGTQVNMSERDAAPLGEGPQKEEAQSLASEKNASVCSERSEKGAIEVATKKAKETDEGGAISSPQTKLASLRGRAEKKDEKRGRRTSSSSDSSSSDSDSSSSHSSGSSSSSPDKSRSTSRGRRAGDIKEDQSSQGRVTERSGRPPPDEREVPVQKKNQSIDDSSHDKKPVPGVSTEEEKKLRTKDDGEGQEEKKDKPREVKEITMAEPEKAPESCEETPKAFAARRISLSSSKSSPGSSNAEGDQESGGGAGRKRRWGSSTAVTAKKPSISITTDSLKSLIPDIRPCPGQEAVVDLHPEEAVLSGAEDEDKERPEQDLQIRRTVTQVVPSETQENGQKEAKRSRREDPEDDNLRADRERRRGHEEKTEASFPIAMETQSPSHTSNEVEMTAVSPGNTLIRRSISQQKSGVSITIDDPVRTARQPSPPHGKVSNIVHVTNLVRPFTLGQLKELLGKTGSLLEDGFWIDKIKSHCYVTYSSSEEATATRAALHGVKWPQSNPKVLSVDFCQQDELDFHKGLGSGDRPAEDQGAAHGRGRASGLPSLLPERDQWAEREREMERRERARAEREWDRDKVREFGKPGEEHEGGARRSRSRERRRKERGKSKEKKTDKKEKAPEEAPAKLLDDLFRKTKAAPCIYWLPLTEEQFAQREAARAERLKEREKRRKEMQEEDKKREEERKERMKAGSGTAGADRAEGEKDKERDRERDRERERAGRDRESDKRRDGYRRPGGGGGGSSAGRGRRSRSRSDPRDRRR